MCGIAGILHWGKYTDPSLIKAMCDSIAHRGPDAEGIEHLPEVSLGHRRLSIIDLSAAAIQPMSDAGKRYHIVFNGEIYNYRELKKELLAKGFVFNNNSDTEVILNAYACWGIDCLKRFNGMFAFALWDVSKKELFMARDRFGKKPFYYSFTADRQLVFGSELQALLKHPGVSSRWNYEALNCYLAIGYVLAPLSIYEGVYKLEQASYMLVSERGEKVEKGHYWDYSEEFRVKTKDSEATAKEKILLLLDEAIKRRMISDVPVGAFLSGGVDSSSIVAGMKKFHNGELHTFSIGFEQDSYNELHDAERMASFLKTNHHSHVVGQSGAEELMKAAIDGFDEPFADNSLIPMLEVSRLARQHVTVALSGDGADELFAGYITYKADKYYQVARRVPAVFRKLALEIVKNSRDNAEQKIGMKYRMRQFLQGAQHTFEKAHYSWRLFFSPEERIAIMGEEYRQLVYDTDPYLAFKKYFDKVPDLHWLDRSLYVDGMTWLTDDILVKVDRTTMQCGLEARAPYLDKELVAYAASLPVHYKLNGLKTKYILKAALESRLPKETLYKKKSGFNAPVGKWIGISESDEFKSFSRFVYNKKKP